MIIRMENAEGLSLPQMEALLETSQEVRFAAKGRKEIYEWVERVLVRQEYATDGGTLDFRGVQAWDAMAAIVMASGPGEKSRLYKTVDGCKKWVVLLSNEDKDGFRSEERRVGKECRCRW